MQAVVVGFFNFSGLSKSPGYKEFYQSAIRSLEKDPNQEVIYAVVTDPRTAESNYGVVTFPHARLFMWNESLVRIFYRSKYFYTIFIISKRI